MHEGTAFRDIPLRVAEMTGEPGDLVLWHPNLLHTYSPHNATDTPRLVLSVTILAGP
jgi:ectoine hydroxylase-related dioxygenase (phytanoyl-CoA dioxygenase family)